MSLTNLPTSRYHCICFSGSGILTLLTKSFIYPHWNMEAKADAETDLSIKTSSPFLKIWRRLTCEECIHRKNNCHLLRPLPPCTAYFIPPFSSDQICNWPGWLSPRLPQADLSVPHTHNLFPAFLPRKCNHHTSSFLQSKNIYVFPDQIHSFSYTSPGDDNLRIKSFFCLSSIASKCTYNKIQILSHSLY